MPSGYRTVSKTSDVDESLFNQKMKKRSNNEAYITSSQYKKIASHCVLLSKAELADMENISVIRTQKDRDAAKAKREKEDRIKRARALRRKERILKLAEAAKKLEAKTPLQIEQEQEIKDQLKEANKLRDEQLDEVKMMNRKVQYAVTVAVRDRQIAEKERIKKEEEDEERRLDLLMEIERLKKIQKDEQKKMLDKQKKMRVNDMLMRQKEDARKAKMLEQERKIQEGILMVKQYKESQDEEKRMLTRKRMEGKKLLEEVLAANEAAIRRKEQRKEEEKLADERIAQYQREKNAREKAQEEALAEKRRIEEAKFHAQSRSLQKMQDNEGEILAKRNRRYQDERERKERDAEREKEAQRQKMLREMQRARETQMAIKQQAREIEASQQKKAFDRILAENKKKNQEREAAERAKRSTLKSHQEELITQIRENEEKRRQARTQKFDEGRQIKIDELAYQQKLQRLRKQKIEMLTKKGVPLKYHADLSKMKFRTGK